MFPNKQTVGSVMPGATASASESARPVDVPSCSYVEHLSLRRWSFLKILDMFELPFWGIRCSMGGCGVPSHVNRSCPVAPHLNRSAPVPAHVNRRFPLPLTLSTVPHRQDCHFGRIRIMP
jgi:hypothetical protein